MYSRNLGGREGGRVGSKCSVFMNAIGLPVSGQEGEGLSCVCMCFALHCMCILIG